MEKIIVHPDLGKIKFQKRVGNKNIRISVHPRKGVLVTLPWYTSFSRAIRFAEENSSWIKGRIEFHKTTYDHIEIEAMRKEAKKLLPEKVKFWADKYDFHYNRIAIKNNISNWGSCSMKNNINLNLQLLRLPEELIDFVILHELCHLKHRNHGKEFHKMLDSLCNGREKELTKKLKGYKLL